MNNVTVFTKNGDFKGIATSKGRFFLTPILHNDQYCLLHFRKPPYPYTKKNHPIEITYQHPKGKPWGYYKTERSK